MGQERGVSKAGESGVSGARERERECGERVEFGECSEWGERVRVWGGEGWVSAASKRVE